MNRKIISLTAVLLLILSACTFPQNLLPPTPGLPLPTLTLEELPAATAVVAPSATPLPDLPTATSVLPSETPLPVPTLTPEPTLSPTPFDFPVVIFNTNANCRFGPSRNYNIQTSFLSTRSTTAEGRNQDASWLWVKASVGHCWISASTIKDPISFTFLPVISFVPLPEAPSRLIVTSITCSSRVSVALRWPDVIGETGYNLYRDGITIIKLKADTNEYIDYPPAAATYFYEIESFNDAGISVRFGQTVQGCP